MDQKKSIQLKINDEQLKGSYANMMKVSYQRESFVLDFAHLMPPQGIITARVITSPSHLKQMINVLQNSLKLYEDKFGEVKGEMNHSSEIGFQPTDN